MRLALSGQLGEGALASAPMLEAMKLCVSCKACKVDCPFGVDIPKLKVETLAAARALGRGSKAADFFARLPEYTDRAARWRFLLAMRDLLPGLSRLSERHTGLAADRPWPRWSGRRSASPEGGARASRSRRHFRRHLQSLVRARKSARRGGGPQGGWLRRYRVCRRGRAAALLRTHLLRRGFYRGKRAREAERMTKAAASFADKGIPVVGLEPSCVLMMRDEYAGLGFPVPQSPQSCCSRNFSPRV